MGKIKINKRLFHSKALIFSLIFSFILLIASEATPNKVDSDSNKEFKPVVRVKEAQERIPAAQKERFERLIKEGKRLLLEEMDYEGAMIKFNEAKNLAISREQKADTLFYLSLVFFASSRETRIEDCDGTIRKLIEIDYYRELDSSLCPPRYIELFREIKKEYGVLIVQSKPAGADVYINDIKDPAGITPLTIGSKAGSVKIKVKKGKKEKKEILRVIAGEKITSPLYILKGGSSLILVLGGIVLAGGGAVALLGGKKGNGEIPAPTTGSIQVNSTPTGASVYLDGTDTGQSTNCTLTNVSPGSHTIELIKEGYEDFQQSISVTAGQTTTVNANLTTHTITVTNPTSDTIWIKGESVQITWETSGSANYQGNVGTSSGLRPLSYPGRNLSPSFQRRAFQYKRSFRRLMRTRRGLESMDLSKNRQIILNDSSKFQDVSKKLFSHAKEGNIIHQRAKNIGIIEKNKGFSSINLPLSPGISPRIYKPLGKIRALIITNVKIELYKGTSLIHAIVPSTENDGSYIWIVDTSLADGTDYKARISCASYPEVYGESDEFQITHGYEFLTKWGYEGSFNGQFYNPRGIAVDSSGYVYVADFGNHRVQKFTSDGAFVSKWGTQGDGDGQFYDPTGIAVDSSGYVYVADENNKRIQKFTSDGTFVTKWGSYGSGDGQFDHPSGIAVDSSGYIYVADTLNNRIQKFTSNGAFVTKWGNYGSGDSQFMVPRGILVDGAGYVFVADTDNDRIQKFTSGGVFVSKWGTHGSGDGQLNVPEGIAVDSSGYVYVADPGNDRIQKFTSDGTFITKWGSTGNEDGQFNHPPGIAVDSSGYVYVADMSNNRIQKFGPISSAQQLIRNNAKVLDNNLSINKNSTTKSYNMKSPLQNKLKNQKNQVNKDTRKNDKRRNSKDRK